MNDRISEKAICPFYQTTIRSKRMVGVECESIDQNLGFRTAHFVRLFNYRDLTDFTEIFCCDMWETCPYAQALLNGKYKESL